MTPPAYADLAKPASSIFTKSYPLGLFKLDGFMQSPGNASLTTSTAVKLNEWTLENADINCSYLLNPTWLNTTVCQSWDLENKLKLGVTVNNGASYVPGLRVAATGTVDPDTGKCSGKITKRMRTAFATIDASFEGGDDTKTLATGAIVAGHAGWIAGAKGNYNLDEGQFTSTSFALGKMTRSFQIHGFLDDFEKYRASIYQRVSDRVEGGVNVSWKAGTAPSKGDDGESGPLTPSEESGCEIGIGAKILLTPFTTLQAKINTDSNIGLSVESEIRDGVVLTLAAGLNGKNISEGKHQIGLGIEFDSGCK